jgi:ABC-type antimicrobial peptide transport system permease subunit
MALGASPGEALSMMLGYGLRLTVSGIAAGAMVAMGLTQWMKNLLFEVKPIDPAVFAIAAFTLSACALLACYVPARRATRVDAMVALRQSN